LLLPFDFARVPPVTARRLRFCQLQTFDELSVATQ